MIPIEQIQELIEKRPHQKEINRARIHQNRLRFHTETEILKSELSENPYYNDFLNWICSEKPELLPKDKVERFKQLLTCPLSTIQLTESVFTALSRVFDGQDSFCRYDFDKDDNLTDWDEYRSDTFWKEDGFEALKNAIDSVWVVDLPSEQKGDKPEPKDLLINIESVIDLSCNKSGECQYVIFTIGDNLLVYDDYSIRKFAYKGGKIGDLVTEFIHELDYCPARMFWTDLLKKDNVINHKAPLTEVLSELDWLLSHKTFKKYMDIANSYPILVKYQSGGDIVDLTREDNKGRSEGENKTAGGRFVGPGSIMEVPVPMEGQPDLMSNPVSYITPPIEALKFHVSEDERLSDYIYKICVGIDGEQNNDMAKNEKQVMASFESQTTILRRIASNFEKVQTFADKVKIQLRYGEILEPSIDYGSKFFLKTASDLASEKDTFEGDDIMDDAITSELIEAKFRNDAGGKIRARVIRDLDPLPGRDLDEVIRIRNAGGIDDETFRIKVNFMSFVMRFEREQLPIAQFMKDSDYKERVNLIKGEFKKYASEFKKGDNDRAGERSLLSSVSGEEGDKPEGPDAPGNPQEDTGAGAGELQ